MDDAPVWTIHIHGVSLMDAPTRRRMARQLAGDHILVIAFDELVTAFRRVANLLEEMP